MVSSRVSCGGNLTDLPTGILEHGEIFFLYRPKVQLEEVESFSDIAQ